MLNINSSSNGIFLQFEDTNGWKLSINDEILNLSLSDKRVLLALLPFLEIGRCKIYEQIDKSEALASFPESILIKSGFINGSEHWSKCAINWLKQSNIENFDEYTDFLTAIINNKKKYGQRLRHKAQALLKK